MTKSKSPNSQKIRLGSKNNASHVAQSVACITLEGLQPSKRAISLATLIANGEMTSGDAIEILKFWYSH